MTKQDYLKLLVEDIHSTTIATIGADGHPQTRVIDMMLSDEQGVYFLTAKGKAFYAQLMEQGYIALSATKNKISISLRGKIKNIGSELHHRQSGTGSTGLLCRRRLHRLQAVLFGLSAEVHRHYQEACGD